ncbi:hypothetical protein [Metabacillus malikii]|uniref:Phage protein n=1 Tax=Metabacillus malikii TaxID=1504265 RepID=A0ABT9Z9X5_9BACI|nr:hypothetical protein [Metabacillus malikii]MDQ0229058.1 hypothetical protein [Metabacillus malikii]
MIIKIDGYYHQKLLTGKKCTKQQLKQKYLEVKAITSEMKDLAAVFCRLNNFEEIADDDEIEVDFVIDTDTDRIYSPSY